ncbi:MAG: glycosyltransferase family 2 protein, partial [Planctomycetota bacterium]
MPVQIKKYVENPLVSIIIPSLYFDQRNENIHNLIKDIENQTLKDIEIIFVIGDNRQGRAINTGAKIASGDILVILDDDTRLGNNKVIENLYNALQKHNDYGL